MFLFPPNNFKIKFRKTNNIRFIYLPQILYLDRIFKTFQKLNNLKHLLTCIKNKNRKQPELMLKI